ncbi:uncharacterized protein LOC134243943 [Saccostrea cucullata]|uniref:uncharacterized protein LOC134243943 n=1 Tax=Saccostrea cuccullata TaxID=36930 RepID=UPI002ED24EE9
MGQCGERRVVFVWEYACKFLYFFTWSTSTVSAAMLLVIAINRYLKVCRPNSTQMTSSKRKLALGCTVLLSTAITLPLFHFMGPIEGSLDINNATINVTTCGVKKELAGVSSRIYFFFELLLSLINMILTVALYIPIGITIYQKFHSIRNSKRVKKLLGITNSEMSDVGTSDDTSETTKVNNVNYKDALQNVLDTSVCERKNSHRRRIRHNFTSMFVTIVLVYVLSYLPTFILIILPSKNPFAFWFYRDDVSLNILVILKRSFIINHIVNPLVYGYFDLHFRSLFMQSISCRKRN